MGIGKAIGLEVEDLLSWRANAARFNVLNTSEFTSVTRFTSQFRTRYKTQGAAETVPVYRLDYTNTGSAAQRITVNGDTVVHRIPPGGKKSVPMEVDDAVVILALTGDDDSEPLYAGTVIGQSGGIFLELRPADDPNAAPQRIRLQTRRRLL